MSRPLLRTSLSIAVSATRGWPPLLAISGVGDNTPGVTILTCITSVWMVVGALALLLGLMFLVFNLTILPT
jgi:hypothetical protein